MERSLRERMGPPPGVLEFVERLEDRIADLVAGEDRVALAYSGGLASTLLAMVARKRCDLVCVVAGVEDSPDIRAAEAAKDHLDFRVQFVRIDLQRARRIHEDLGAANRRLSATAIRAVAPLHAVREETHNDSLLSAFGSRRSDGRVGAVLRAWGIRSPFMNRSGVEPVARSTVVAAAVSLGLPVEWARMAHRSPATGSGIGNLLPTNWTGHTLGRTFREEDA